MSRTARTWFPRTRSRKPSDRYWTLLASDPTYRHLPKNIGEVAAMRLATVLTPMSDENLRLAAQCGVTDVVHRYPGEEIAVLRAAKQRIASFGMRLSVVEGYLPIENIKLGCDDGRELTLLKTLVRHMAELDIRLL